MKSRTFMNIPRCKGLMRNAIDIFELVLSGMIVLFGLVRRIAAVMMALLKKAAVIPVIWKTWAFRGENSDLGQTRALGISVLNTDKHHPDLRIFDYISHLALKFLFEAQVEAWISNTIMVGTGEFTDITVKTLKRVRAFISNATPEALQVGENKDFIRVADAMSVAEHRKHASMIAPTTEYIESLRCRAFNSSISMLAISKSPKSSRGFLLTGTQRYGNRNHPCSAKGM
jgi:hypothetical protein